MRLLGLDIGSKKVGIAISDKTLTVARPLKTVLFKQLQTELKEILIEYNDVEGLVIGLPVSQSGEKAEQIKLIGQKLNRVFQLEVFYEDERLTSWEAREILKDEGYNVTKIKELEDQVAAKLILQSYLSH
ncbi:MAG: Holliday junction resolvase RuvX [Candidatus Caenarcaniphilales bacterium]|nr:Holliday junction resolvase RuvX [Candidatus Caenarcaniphilales bacterium]